MKMMITLIIIITITAIIFVNEVTILEKFSVQLVALMFFVFFSEVFSAGGRFSKDPVTYRAQKEILETMIRLP